MSKLNNDNADEEVEYKILYFKIPEFMLGENNKLNDNYLDDDGNILNIEDETEVLFYEWDCSSACVGVCCFTDTYTVKGIEWVVIC